MNVFIATTAALAIAALVAAAGGARRPGRFYSFVETSTVTREEFT